MAVQANERASVRACGLFLLLLLPFFFHPSLGSEWAHQSSYWCTLDHETRGCAHAHLFARKCTTLERSTLAPLARVLEPPLVEVPANRSFLFLLDAYRSIFFYLLSSGAFSFFLSSFFFNPSQVIERGQRQKYSWKPRVFSYSGCLAARGEDPLLNLHFLAFSRALLLPAYA